jgi:probable O-glycosylation ligase (exosortase A-associated)
MPIRDYALTAFVLALVPVCIGRPWLGILAWYWLGLMSPHRLTWAFAYTMQFALLIGGATLLGALFARDRRPIPWERELVLMLMLLAYFTFTSFFAWAPDYAWPQLEKLAKIVLMTVVATMFIYGKARIRYLLLVVAGSIGFYGIKGGIWSIMTGGGEQVLGPEGSFIEGNTALSLALNMVIPLIVAHAREEKSRWFRRLLYLSAVLSVVASFFTYSRGGWLGLAVVIVFLMFQLKNTQRVLLASMMVAIFLAAHSFLPERVFTRADTLENYEQDCSANQRFMAWTVYGNIARTNPLTGGGFQLDAVNDGRWLALGDEKYLSCMGEATTSAAHSIYFQILGEHGFVAFSLFIFLLASSQLKLSRLRREAKRRPEIAWIGNYATGLQIGLLAFMVSGAFLSLAYFDLPWLYYALTVMLSRELDPQTFPAVVHSTPMATRHAATEDRA